MAKNKLEDEITSTRLATKIRQLKQSKVYKDKTILILEGVDDRTFFNRFIDFNRCAIELANGKENALASVEILKKDSKFEFKGVLAVLDTDFDLILSKLIDDSNIIYTDTHDLETMLLKSEALDVLIQVSCSSEKMQDFNQDIRKYLLEKSCDLGCLRLISIKEKLYLDFDINLENFINKDTLEVNMEKLIIKIKKQSIDKINSSSYWDKTAKESLISNISTLDFNKAIEKIKDADIKIWHLCCGHDILEVLRYGFAKKFASYSNTELKYFDILKKLIMAYEYSFFIKTSLYENIIKWENINNPYQLLKQNS